MVTKAEEKIANSYKGLLRTKILHPINKKSKPLLQKGNIGTFKIFTTDGESVQLFLSRDKFAILFKHLLERFPGLISLKDAQNIVFDNIQSWIENSGDFTDQRTVEKYVGDLINEISDNIEESDFLIPLVGLNVEIKDGIKIIDCDIFSPENSGWDFSNALDGYPEDWANQISDIKVSAYVRVRGSGYKTSSLTNAIIKANDTLDIIRLYMGSYYFQQHEKKYGMGVQGSLQDKSISFAYTISNSKKIKVFKASFSNLALPIWDINNDGLSSYKEAGFDLVSELYLKDDLFSNRIKNAVRWFSRGTQAKELKESFLMYAISLESLLSQTGRTSQKSYRIGVGKLYHYYVNDLKLYPQSISKKLGKALRKSDLINVVESELGRLLGIRNKIAHGEIVDINPVDLLNIESLARIAIIAMVNGKWSNFQEYLKWSGLNKKGVFWHFKKFIINLRRR